MRLLLLTVNSKIIKKDRRKIRFVEEIRLKKSRDGKDDDNEFGRLGKGRCG